MNIMPIGHEPNEQNYILRAADARLTAPLLQDFEHVNFWLNQSGEPSVAFGAFQLDNTQPIDNLPSGMSIACLISFWKAIVRCAQKYGLDLNTLPILFLKAFRHQLIQLDQDQRDQLLAEMQKYTVN